MGMKDNTVADRTPCIGEVLNGQNLANNKQKPMYKQITYCVGLSIRNSKRKINSPDLGTLLPLVFPIIPQQLMIIPASTIYQTLNP